MAQQNDSSKEDALKSKVQKDMPEFADAVDKAQLPQLEAELLKYAKYREETEMHRKKNESLEKAKNVVKELNAPYNETLNALKLKTAYLGLLIAERKDSAK